MGKTIRFGDLVRNSGRPQTVTLWTTPEHNPALTHAIKQNRVLTVLQEAGRKDHGLVGFRSLPGALYLIFPRPLPQEPDASVIGINYQLIEEPEVSEKDRARPEKQRPPPVQPKMAPKIPKERKPTVPKPERREFTIRIRRTATQEIDVVVKALDQTEAEQKALQRAKQKPFKSPETEVRTELVKPD